MFKMDMYNCLKLPTSRFRKFLAVLIVFSSIFMSAQATTYYWVGGESGNWNNAANWSTTEGGSGGTGTAYPGADDTVYIYGNVNVAINSAVSIGKLLIEASAANYLGTSFTTTLSGSGSLSVTDSGDAINITRCSSTDGVIGTLEIKIPVTCTDSIQTHSGTTLSVTDRSLTAANLTHSAYGDTPKSELQISGTLNITNTLNLNAMAGGATQLSVASGGQVNAKNITFGSETYSNDGATSAIINNGTISVSGAFTIPALNKLPYAGSGTIKLDGTGTGASFSNSYAGDGGITIAELQGVKAATISGDGKTTITNATFNDNITLSGANTFKNFTATGLAGKTLKVNAEQTFQTGGAVNLSGTGTDAADRLTVTGNASGKFTLGTAPLTGNYLSLDTDSSVVSASTGTAFAQNSVTTGSGTTNWIVASAAGHLWNGGNGDWETETNWLPQSVPGSSDEVIINSGNPTINSAASVKSISLAASTSVTVAASKSLTISEGCELDEKITGAGKLILASGENYTVAADSTININVENNGSLSSTGAATFSRDFTNSGSATFTGGISVSGNLTDTGTDLSGPITFTGTSNQTFTPRNTIYPNITVNKSERRLTVDGDLQVTNLTLTDGAVTFGGNPTLWDGSDFQDFDFTSLAGTISFSGGTAASPNILKAKDITSSQKITAGYLKIDAANITLNNCKNISNPVLEATGNIAINGIEAQSLSVNSGASSVKAGGTIKLTNAASDFVIDYPLVLSGNTTFDVAGNIIIRNSTSSAKVGSINSDSTARELSLTAGSGKAIKIQNGAGFGTASSLSKITLNSSLELSANTTFNSPQTNFAGTSLNAVSGAYSLSVKGNVTDSGTWSWATGSTLLFDGTDNQTLKTNTNSTFYDVSVNKSTGNFIIDTSVLNVHDLTITNCDETQFTGENQITASRNLSFTKAVSANNNLTISATSGAVTFGSTFESTGDLSVTSSTLDFNNTVSVKNFTIDATTTTSSDITVSGSWTNYKSTGGFTASAGTVKLTTDSTVDSRVTLSGTNTFNNLNLDRNVSVLSSNTITNDLIMHRTAGDAAAKGNIYFAANTKQTIGGNFDFKGLTSKRLLATSCNAAGTPTSNGIWEIQCASASVQNVNLSNCKNSSTFPIVVEDPVGTLDSAKSLDGGKNTNFYFLNHSYTWVGGTTSHTTDWNNATNWTPQSIPGKGTKIIIPSGKTYYPRLIANLDLSYNSIYTGSILIADGAKFDLANKNLTVGTITNDGIVGLHGLAGQTINAVMINGSTETSSSTVEYYNDSASPPSTVNFVWDGNTVTTDGKQYKNLIINNTTSSSDNITISGNLEINAATTLSGTVNVSGTTSTTTIKAGTGKTVSLNNPGNSFAGTVIAGTTDTPAAIAGALTLNAAATGFITLANNANADSLTINCPIKLQNVTTSGTQLYNSTVETITGVAALTSTAGSITFENSLSSSVATTISATAGNQITFNGTVTGSAKLKTIGNATAIFNNTVYSLAELETNAATINCSTLSTTGNQTYNGAVSITTIGGASVSSSTGNLNFNDSVTGDSTLTVSTGNTDSNSINFTGTVGTAGSPLAGLSIGTAKTTTFTNAVNITSFSDITGSGEITFRNGGTITAASGQIFNTTGKVIFGDAASDIMNIGTASPFKNITHITGETQIAGTLNAADMSFAKTRVTNAALNGAVITFSGEVTGNSLFITKSTSTSFNAEVALSTFTDTTNSGAISFNAGGSIAAVGGQTFITPGTVTFGNDSRDSFIIGSSTTPQSLIHTAGGTTRNGTLTAANITFDTTSITGTLQGAAITLGNTSGGPMTITNSGLLQTVNGKSISYTTGFTQNGSGNTILKGSFGSAAGNGNASFATSVLINTSSAENFGSTSGNDTISITKDFIITAPAAGLTINGDTSVHENLVMYTGPVTANADITADKDILILGSSYSEEDSSTNITDEYAYTSQRPAGWSTVNYNATQLPDGNTLPSASSYSASLSVASGRTITAGKNFYVNGTTLSRGSGSGQWNLKVPDLTNPANGFAEAYHSVVSNCNVICTDNSSDGSKARLIALECTEASANSNTNVDFDEFKITSAYTIRDNAVCVEFNRPVRYHTATMNALKFHDSSDAISASTNFTGFYSDPDCTSALNIGGSFPSYTSTADGNTYYYCYIKAAPQDSAELGAWNTDATGKDSGTAKSSDRAGIHHTSLPTLDFPRSLQTGTTGNATGATLSYLLTDLWGKRLNNYSRRVPKATAEPAYGSTASTNNVDDKTGPVLWTVRTGQELHTFYNTADGEASQHSYDSHNFLEFRYSEPVDIGTITAYNPPADPSHTPNVIENIQVTDTLGAINETITYSSGTLTFAGLARITGSSLILNTGSNGAANKYMNALYRNDEYSIRLSLAGWTNGTVADYSGNDYKKWPGYIENASQFTGARAHTVAATNTLVKDQAGNAQIEYEANKAEPFVISNSSDSNSSNLLPVTPDLYSQWDLSSPVFTPLRFSNETQWGNQDMAEAIGNTNGSGSTLDRIDFHFFDNTPSYSNGDEAEWYTEIGWCIPGTTAAKSNLKNPSYTYCADIIGGARQFDTDSTRRTSGGIRFSTKADISSAFRYSTDSKSTSPGSEFLSGPANVYTTVISQLFTGSSEPMRPANDPDGLYLGLKLSDSGLSVETTFAFSYNESLGYLTDLAGNRLRNKVFKTIDRTPPSFDIILSPVDDKEVFIIFVKELVTDSEKIKFRDNDGHDISINEDFNQLLPKCFRLISIDSNGNAVVNEDNQIDTNVPAELIESNTNDSFTCFKLTLKNNITIDDVKNLYVQLIIPPGYPDSTSDPLTNNINSKVTFIQDQLGNYMSVNCAHILSDFAINYVNPLYAYSSDMIYNDEPVMKGLYEEGSWAVHDWNSDQQNYGTLPADHPIALVADTKGNDKIRIYLSSAPDEASVSNQFNKDFGTEFRVWLPDLTDGAFRALSTVNNTNYVQFDGALLSEKSSNSIFNINQETVSAWESGNQISFMFGLMEDQENPVRIYSNPYFDISAGRFNLALSSSVPLYSLRMNEKSNINSLDLWSFKLKSIKNQRGGVTILNNVINADKAEKTVVKVDLPEEGRLNVCVMTLDGNIITYLNRGRTKAGEHYFTWNGKNKNGKSVARGMYFVRVTGADIDETRKVMVVKD